MTLAQKIEAERSKLRERMAELAAKGADMSEDERTEMGAAETRLAQTEGELRAALAAEPDPAPVRTRTVPDGELRERMALRQRASVGRYIAAKWGGRLVDGAEAELLAAAGVRQGCIPVEIFEPDRPEPRERAATGVPSTTGVNLQLRPYLFANTIASRFRIDMPMAESGTFSSATLTTPVTAGAVAESAAVPVTAGAWTPVSTEAHRVGGALELTAEARAKIGAEGFESITRTNLRDVITDAVDKQIVTGDNVGANIKGLHKHLSYVDDSTEITFDGALAKYADLVEGHWAMGLDDVRMMVGVNSYRKLAKEFRDIASTDNGDISALDYLRQRTGGLNTSSRMPVADTTNKREDCIAVRTGHADQQVAVCPYWSEIEISNPYTQDLKATERFTVHVLIGDVILVQPLAFAPVSIKYGS